MKIHCDGGEAMLEGLRSLGVEYIMSSPGSEWGALWEALARQTVDGTKGPKYLSCWHETLAANMAMGYWLVTGRMQAVVLHAGVGLLQGAVGIHAAHIQNVPMIVFSGEALTYGELPGFDPGSQWYQNLSVVGGPQRMVEPYTKWASQAPSVQTLYEIVIRAGQIAQRGPMGPVYLNVPIETQLAAWTRPTRLASAPAATPPRAPVADIERVAELLIKAKNPVITTEAGGRQPESYAALMALAESLSIPVVETHSWLFSNFPKDHPLHQGPNFKPFFESADLVLIVRSRAPWYPPGNWPPNATIVLIDENPYRPHMVYQNLHADTVLEGDVAFTLETLTAAAKGSARDAQIETRRARHAGAHLKQDEARLAHLATAKKKHPIDPAWLAAALSDTLPADTVYVDEIVTHRREVDIYLRNQGPGSFIKVRGGLGQGIGHAIGAKLALPDRTVVCLTGDGSFLYNPIMQCLGYAEQAKLPVIIVVFNNRKYLAMSQDHTRYYPDGVAKAKQLFYGEMIGSDPALSRFGEPFGCWGRRVEDPNELAEAIRAAHQATLQGKTAILDVIVDP